MNKGSTSIFVLLYALLHITVLGQQPSGNAEHQQAQIVPHTLVFKVDENPQARGGQQLDPHNLPFPVKGLKPITKNVDGAARGGKRSVLDGIYRVQLQAGEDVLDKCRELETYGNILYAEPLYQEQLFFIPSDPEANTTDGKQSYLSVIKAYDAWEITQGSEEIIIGVIDTGADMDHEDLSGNMYVNEGEVINGKDDDGNGYIDDRLGYDFANADNDPQSDGSRHGSLVGGLAAAHTDNDVGIAGLGFKSKLAPLKAFTSEANISFGTYEAIVYAADNGYDVLNLSWGSVGSYSQFNQDVIDYAVVEKDVVIVAAAGNNNQDAAFYPASYDNVLSVAATDNSDSKSSFSTYNNKVDLAAPGSAIYSTSNDGYDVDWGTSYASPIVAGVAALVRAQYPDLNARQVMERVRVTADDIYNINSSPLLAGKLGKGRLNAAEAVGNPSIKAARITEFQASGRDGADIFYGDSIYIDLTVENFLDSLSDLRISLSTYDEEITIEEIAVGALATFETKSFVRIKGFVNETVEPGTTVEIRASFEDDDYLDFQQFDVDISPDYLDFQSGAVLLSVGGNGDLGKQAGGSQGQGLQLSSSLLAEQIGLIFSTDHDQVADNGPVALSSNGQNQDFTTEAYIKPYYNSIADTYTYNVFHDGGELGLKVEQSTMAWQSVDSAMVVDYRVINTSGASFPSLSTGIFWNWDLEDESKNRASWDQANTAYAWNGDSTLFAGIRVIGNGTVRHSALDISDENGNLLDTNVLNDSLKHYYLAEADLDDAGTIGAGNDIAQIIGITLDTLPSYEAAKVTYLIAFAEDLVSLKSKLSAVQELHGDFVENPPVAATFYSCEGAFTDLTMTGGTNFNFYTDPYGDNLAGTGPSITVGPVTSDTTMYVAQADSAYEGAIYRSTIQFVEQVADFAMDKEVVYLGGGSSIVKFTDQSFEANSWQWNFGNGDAATVQHPKLVYSKPGTYTIELSVETEQGCSGSISKELQVIDRPASLGIEKVEVCMGEDIVIEGNGTDGLRVYASAADSTYLYDGPSITLEQVSRDTILLISNVVDGFESEIEPLTVDVIEVSPTYTMMPALDSLGGDYLWLINTSDDHESLSWTIDDELVSTADTFAIASAAGTINVELITVNNIGCAGTMATTLVIDESALPACEKPEIICLHDQVVIEPTNGSYFGFYRDEALTDPIYKGSSMVIDSIGGPTTLYVAGLDNGLAGEAIEIILEPNELDIQILPEMDELYLDQGRNVSFQLDTVLLDTRWYLDNEFYDAAIQPIINFNEEGVYDIKVEGQDSDGCLYTTTLAYQVSARTPLVLNVAPGEDVSLSVYPNPSSDYIHLMTEDLVSHLSILDVRGQLLKEKHIPSAAAGRSAHGLAIQDLPSGPYVIRVVFADGHVESRRFLKK